MTETKTDAKVSTGATIHRDFEIKLHPDDVDEDIFRERENDSCIPVEKRYAEIYDNYKRQTARFWVPEKFIFSDDKKAWQITPEPIQNAISKVLGYFAGSDDIVSQNIGERTAREVKAPWVRRALKHQDAMEGIHSDTYNTMIAEIIPDRDTRMKLFNAVNSMESVKQKAEWARKWIRGYYPFRIRCAAYTAVEGIHFSASFAFIDWLKTQKYKYTGLFESNADISIDESMHVDLTTLIHNSLDRSATRQEVKAIYDGALAAERIFIDDFIPEGGFPQLTRDSMYTHVVHCANMCAAGLGHHKLYGYTSSPFSNGILRSLNVKTNFHEGDNVHYTKAGVGHTDEERQFSIEDDF